MEHRIIFATGNAGKMKEVRMILGELGIPVLSMKEAGIAADIVENGKSFEENAVIKAETIRDLTADGDLLDSADGLTTSQDETAQASSSEKEESLPALSWVLVLQCILIVLVPALVVGGVLMALLIYIKNREEIE